MRCLVLIFFGIIVSGCHKDNGKFVFYHSATPVYVEDFKLYSTKLNNNIVLAIKDDHQRNFLINNKVDSLHYIIADTVYKACKMKLNMKYCGGFNFEVWRGGEIMAMGFTPENEELIHIGQKEDLKFITTNNELFPVTDEKEFNKGDFSFFFGHDKEPMIVGNYEVYKQGDKYYLLIKSAGQRFFLNEAAIDSIHFTIKGKKYRAPGLFSVPSSDFTFRLVKGRFHDTRINIYHQELFYIGKKEDIEVVIDNCKVKG